MYIVNWKEKNSMNSFDRFKEYFLRVQNITAVGVSTLIANGISSIFLIYLASLLGVEGFGELGYLLAVIGVSGGVASLGTVNALIVYVSKGEKIQATLFFIVLCSAIIVGISSFIIFKNEAVAIYPLGYVIFSSVLFDLLGRKSFVNYGKIMVSQRIIMVTLALLLYQQYGIYGIVLGYSLSFFPFTFLMYRGFKESKIDLLKELGLNSDGEFVLDSQGDKLLDKYLEIPVKIDNMVILPGSTIVLDDNELSLSKYLEEFGDVL